MYVLLTVIVIGAYSQVKVHRFAAFGVLQIFFKSPSATAWEDILFIFYFVIWRMLKIFMFDVTFGWSWIIEI